MTLGLQYIHDFGLSTWCSGYHYCTTSFNKAWTQVLRRFKSCSRRVGDSRWWGSLTVVPAGNKAKRLSSVNHTTKTIHKFINSFIIDFGFDIFSDILKKIYFFDSEIHNLDIFDAPSHCTLCYYSSSFFMIVRNFSHITTYNFYLRFHQLDYFG